MSEQREGRLPWERTQAVRLSDEAQLAEIEAHARTIAAGAGRLLMGLFQGPLDIQFKDRQQRDPVSEADRGSEEYLRRAILDRFPDHAILGEEGQDAGAPDAEYTWVLDPLDGTTNYINGLPFFSVSVGVLRRGRPAVGAIWTPSGPAGTPAVFSARAGGDASLDGRPISVRDRGPNEALPVPRRLAAVPGGFGVMLTFAGPLAKRRGEPRTLGSIALEGALVSCGVLQYAIFMGPKIWDVAALTTIVRAAGGGVLTRDKAGWHELERFRASPDRKTGAPRPLRTWSAPVIVAAPDLATTVAAGLRPTPLARVVGTVQHPTVRRTLKIARQLRREFGPPRE